MVLKIFMIHRSSMLLIAEDEIITARNAGTVYAYKYDEELDTLTPPVLLMSFLKRDPYYQDPSETDKKRRFELVDDKSIREIVNSAI